jgi:hypothetical protein
MTKRVLDYDPLTGVTTYFEYDALTDRMLLTDVQDVNPILDEVTSLRNNDEYSKRGIKDDMWHYARLPMTVLMEIESKHGVKCMTGRVDWKGLFRVINQHYPNLKATTKVHA